MKTGTRKQQMQFLNMAKLHPDETIVKLAEEKLTAIELKKQYEKQKFEARKAARKKFEAEKKQGMHKGKRWIR